MRRHDIPLALAGLDKLGDAVARLDQESAIGDEIGFVTSCGGRRVMSALPASLHDNTRTAQAAAIIAGLDCHRRLLVVAYLALYPQNSLVLRQKYHSSTKPSRCNTIVIPPTKKCHHAFLGSPRCAAKNHGAARSGKSTTRRISDVAKDVSSR
jgi:hypothetical protein